ERGKKKNLLDAPIRAYWAGVSRWRPVGCDTKCSGARSRGLGLGNRLTGQEQGMAAKRPVLAVAVAAIVVVIGVLAFRGAGGSDSPVVTQAGGKAPAVPPTGAGDDVNTTLASAGRPAANTPRPAEIAAIVGGSVELLD